jgi:hypothetical protein
MRSLWILSAMKAQKFVIPEPISSECESIYCSVGPLVRRRLGRLNAPTCASSRSRSFEQTISHNSNTISSAIA